MKSDNPDTYYIRSSKEKKRTALLSVAPASMVLFCVSLARCVG